MPRAHMLGDLPGDVTAEEHYRDPPDGVRANMITTLDGAAAFDGRVRPWSDPVDQALLLALRTYADVVLVGAGTVRAEHYGPVRLTPEQSAYRREHWGDDTPPPIAVVTRSGTLPLDSPLFASGRRPTVVTTRRTANVKGARLSDVAEVLVVGEDTVDIPTCMSVSGPWSGQLPVAFRSRPEGLTRVIPVTRPLG
ncbi:dihydrofolate reductase family protein [Rhodococcus sp. DK17]|jgi:riboflavin biosynthesis pyrimidine reductase|uniref:dihydrofolate reductase family protein n=1 Tax=Rhodococcus sp. DK17 TaxID=186196 RepID=UPI0009FC33D6